MCSRYGGPEFEPDDVDDEEPNEEEEPDDDDVDDPLDDDDPFLVPPAPEPETADIGKYTVCRYSRALPIKLAGS